MMESADKQPLSDDATVTGSKAWMDEILEAGCYRCGHEGSRSDPCDETCDGLPLSWSQLQGGAA